MRWFFLTFPRNLIDCFSRRMLVWHLLAMVLTFTCVVSGVDWNYFLSTRSTELQTWMFPAVPIGGLLPILVPLLLLVLGSFPGGARCRRIGWAVAQAEIIGGIIAAGYKALTGRAHPAHGVGLDLTHVFRFGLLRGGVFWGWPSSHTTIAFAMAVTVFTVVPKPKWLGTLAIAYAFYIGFGVSMTIHWFSDFLAGAIVGSIVGIVVGTSSARAVDGPASRSQPAAR